MTRKEQSRQAVGGPVLRGIVGGFAAAVLMVALTSSVHAEEYEPSNAGQPLRVAAYVVHPVGVIYDYLILRPAYWIGSQQPFRTLFGRSD